MKQALFGSALLISVTLFAGCQTARPTESTDVPVWAQEAIWYQIFVERFRNGDPTNDPQPEDMIGAWPGFVPPNWTVTSWTHDWYAPTDWARAADLDFYTEAQIRRYGGDLQGVIDRLDYLEQLGITAIYLNPINDSPSLHKYDARNYRHVDRNFGPDPDADLAIMESETPSDPSTWRWTTADSLFLRLIDDVHERGMRVILDYSFNHTGISFWAFQDVLQHQAASPFADWYFIEEFDDPATEENEFRYEAWFGVAELPNLRKIGLPDSVRRGPLRGDLHPAVKAHQFAVARRWLDPNGDGDPSDGLDGFRLDVAEWVPLDYWHDFRMLVKSINPEAVLIGEIWWEDWPDRMYVPTPWLGYAFDAVMNFRWFPPTRAFVGGCRDVVAASEYVTHLDSIEAEVAPVHLRAMMNIAACHDTPRLSSSLYNCNPYKVDNRPNHAPEYRIDRPDADTWARLKLLLVHQFTYIGAPHIWAGDEAGMWGAEDPDDRKPLVWDDLAYEVETTHPLGLQREPDSVAVDKELADFYRRLARMRRQHMDVFAHGDLNYELVDDDTGLLVYSRSTEDKKAFVLLNTSPTSSVARFVMHGRGTFRDVLGNREDHQGSDEIKEIKLEPREAIVYVRD